ncbi:MAG: outer membrane beta-barrel protein [Bacteroidota bacterium]
MKNVLIALLLALPFIAFGQPKEGAIALGTTVGLGNFGGTSSIGFRATTITQTSSFGPDVETKATNFLINPRVGYTVIDGFVVGLGLSWSYNKSESEANGFSSQLNQFAAGPFATYYFDLKPVTPLLVLSTQFGRAISEFDSFNFTNESKSTTFQVFTGAGIAYFANEHVSLEAIIGYDYQETNADNDGQPSNYAAGITFGAGISIFLSGQKDDE